MLTGRQQKKISGLLENLLGSTSISLLDVGAAGGAHERWAVYRKHIDFFAVEPDLRSADSIARKGAFKSETIITRGLWSEEREIILNLCREPKVSSVFTPNLTFLGIFPHPDAYDVLDRRLISVTTIDKAASELGTHFDSIKLDIQGAELEVLNGAESILKTSLAIEVEVEFSEAYQGQPLFDDVFKHLKFRGFEFIDFLSMHRWSPEQFGVGQSVFADVLFMRSPEKVAYDSKINHGVVIKYVAICSVYERGDLILRLANALKSDNKSSDLYDKILEIGQLIHARNKRTQTRLTRLSHLLMVGHISVRGHFFH